MKTPVDEAPNPERSDAVADGIREAITLKRLPPGTKLHEQTLAEVFGVSRTRVREALHRLQYTGIVSAQRKQIARVAQPSVKEAREIFLLRRLVEPEMARAVAARSDLALIDVLRQLVEHEHLARHRGDQVEAIRLGSEFHVRLALASGNAVIAALIRELMDRSFLVTYMYQSTKAVTCVNDEHTELIDRIAAHDEPGAASAMRHHLEQIEERLALREPVETVVDLKAAFDGLASVASSVRPLSARKRLVMGLEDA